LPARNILSPTLSEWVTLSPQRIFQVLLGIIVTEAQCVPFRFDELGLAL